MANVYESVLASGGETPTSITPSNASPAQMVTHVPYEVTQSGYAVRTIIHVTPSGEPEPVGTSDIYKMEAAGYVLDSIGSVAPGNNSPDALVDGKIVRVNGNGYAIGSYSLITPSDSSPVALGPGNIYKSAGNGYAIYSPPAEIEVEDGVQFDAGINNMSAGGYAYTSPRPWVMKSGTLSDFTSSNQEQTIATGLDEVHAIWIYATAYNNTIYHQTVLDTSKSAAKQITLFTNASGTAAGVTTSGSDANGLISSSGNANYMRITAINGGNVTVKGANAANYLPKDVKWWAI